MSNVVSGVDRLETVCGMFIDEFSLDPLGYATERSAKVVGVALSLGMGSLAMKYRTLEEQQAFFETADNFELEATGNPSATIRTWTTEDRNMAVYAFDRHTGLVVVNNFPFPREEVRALRARDAEALGFSIATRGITSATMNRALTDIGIFRLVDDLETAMREA